MTIVIAQRRGAEILLLTDTKVGEPGKTGPDIMPGRLKVIALGNRITVAFAGDADPAGVVVREARKFAKNRDAKAVVELLQQSSAGGATDYLLASHLPEATLLRIRKGVALDVPDICAIGDDAPFLSLIEKARTASDEPFFKSDLRLRFMDRLMTNKDLGPDVGGFPIALGATVDGHRYLGQSGLYTYKFPELKWGEETHQSIDQVYSGDGHFEMSVIPPENSDVPVVGVCLLQARTGYVYSPMEDPLAIRVPLAEPNAPWDGKQHEMFSALQHAIAAHVARVEQF